jgi:hypothetical protein
MVAVGAGRPALTSAPEERDRGDEPNVLGGSVVSAHPYPVRVDAALQDGLSRWLWLVKWVLAIPHFVVLLFLWIAFGILSFVAFFAILFTGRYPRRIFDFNVGVLRWTWRVAYYAYGGLGTDEYPPFSLEERPDYPAHLEVEYPERLSRGLVLVKWWLLAIPHYVAVAIFLGGGWAAADQEADGRGIGLIGLLVLVAAVVLLFTGRYPRSVFDLVLGLNRWVLRVAAYVSLMTDEYPPFRLDQGGADPGTAVLASGEPQPQAVAPPPAAEVHRPWTAGRVVAVVVGAVLAACSLGLLAAGGGALVVDNTLRDDGYLMSSQVRLDSAGAAIVSENVELRGAGSGVPERWLGRARVEATAPAGGPVFVGIARTADVDAYLAGVAHSVVVDPSDTDDPELRDVIGGASAGPPAAQSFWAASATGDGAQALTWEVERGDWTIVVMDPSGAAPVSADVAVGATVPVLDDVGVVLLVAGAVLGVAAVVVLVLALRPRAQEIRAEEIRAGEI